MERLGTKSRNTGTLARRLGAMLGLLTALVLLIAPSAAWAGLEQVGTIAEASSESPLIRSQAVAINTTGAGGVTPGTVYFVGSGGGGVESGVHVYTATGEPVEHWGTVDADGIAIDQATGDVYVRRYTPEAGQNVIDVFTPNGSELLASFAVEAPGNEPTAESPEKLHGGVSVGIAVNNAGDVYLPDMNYNEQVGRIMVFEPETPGDYEHYAYAGPSKDIAYSTQADAIRPEPKDLAMDAAGNLYTTGSQGNEFIYEYSPSEPNAPVCSYKAVGGGIEAMTVDPQTGEVYYYTEKHRGNLFQLSACNANKEFTLLDTLVLSPGVPHEVPGFGLAFDPAVAYRAGGVPGILYAVSWDGLGYVYAPAEVRSPTVESTAESVDSSSAVLSGTVNPHNWVTRYVFQYLTNSAYEANGPSERFAGAEETPVGGGEVEAVASSVGVKASLSGLAPDTEYRYRLVATSHCNAGEPAEVCESVSAVRSLRTYPVESDVLPDGRAYELVSPVDKNGGEVFPLYPSYASCGDCAPGQHGAHSSRQSSPDGEAVVYEGDQFSSGSGIVGENEYVARRTAAGWQTTTLSPALQSRQAPVVGVDASLSADVLLQGTPALTSEAPAGYPDLYSQLTSDPTALSALLMSPAPNRAAGKLELNFAGGSADYSKLFFEANDAFTEATASAPAAVDGGPAENNLYETSGGELKLVNVLPGNEQTAPGAAFGSSYQDQSHAISEDGERVFWSDKAGQVFVREGGVSTREIPDAGTFLTAAADGSKVLLSDGHMFDLENEQTVDLTEGEGGFMGIAGQDEDLSHVYFVDTAVLTGEQVNQQGAAAQAGGDNLYAWSEGTTTFIATLSEEDNVGNPLEYASVDWTQSPQARTAEASPDGRWLAFLSKNRLTGYDNTGPCAFENATAQYVSGACSEVFLFDSQTDTLTCASCDRSGALPLGAAYLPLVEVATASEGQPRYLTDNGRLFFDSRDPLSPFDTNHGVEDVYEYEIDGDGDCTQQAGCVRLISGGRGAGDSDFFATDATGKNVFFTTRDKLVASDDDELIDLYDAREGGGIVSQGEVAQPGECRESCQTGTEASSEPIPASVGFEGTGNLVTPPTQTKQKTTMLTRAQKLAAALRRCRSGPKKRRAACEKRARKSFGKKAGNAKKAQRKGRR